MGRATAWRLARTCAALVLCFSGGDWRACRGISFLRWTLRVVPSRGEVCFEARSWRARVSVCAAARLDVFGAGGGGAAGGVAGQRGGFDAGWGVAGAVCGVLAYFSALGRRVERAGGGV